MFLKIPVLLERQINAQGNINVLNAYRPQDL